MGPRASERFGPRPKLEISSLHPSLPPSLSPNLSSGDMRVRTLEIRWHNGDPIYSCDFQPLPQSQLKKTIAPRIVHKESSTPSSDQKGALPPPPPPAAAASSSSSSTTNTNYGVGQSFRFATGGSDNNVRVRINTPFFTTRPARFFSVLVSGVGN